MGFLISLKEITTLLTIVILLSQVKCDHNHSDIDERKSKYTSVPFSTPEDLLIGDKDLAQKLVRLITDAEFREARNKALGSISPKDSSTIDDQIDDQIDPRIHIHHIFPPQYIRPLQKLIIRKIMHKIKKDPIKMMKKKLIAKAIKGTVAVGVVSGISDLAELKKRPPIAKYRVTGIVDLSSKNRQRNDYESEEHKPKDYELKAEKKHAWPFNEDEDVIYEKWNKFPHEIDSDYLYDKVKYNHKSFHELHPEILHLVHDIHGMFAKKKVYVSAPDLESPLVLFGHLLKLGDSLIPSIRIRIPFVEYLISSFHKKTKPKVVYVKQPSKVEYVPVPYKEEDLTYTYDTQEPQTNVEYVGPQRTLDDKQSENPNIQYIHQMPGRQYVAPQQEMPHLNYENVNRDPTFQSTIYRPKPDYDSRPPPPGTHLYTKIFENEAKLYKDRKKAAKA